MPPKIEAYVYSYTCQVCGVNYELILPHVPDPIVICPECAKRIKKLIYQEDDLK